MSDAPDRLNIHKTLGGGWAAFDDHYGTEYVRADLLDALRADLARLTAERDALREALDQYALTFCELGTDHECCGRLSGDECSGCLARRTINNSMTHDETAV